MNTQPSKSRHSTIHGLRSWVCPLAIALVTIIGVETLATAAFASFEDNTVVYSGKCPGDRDDDCRD